MIIKDIIHLSVSHSTCMRGGVAGDSGIEWELVAWQIGM